MVATEPLGPDVWEKLGWEGREAVGDVRHLFFYAQRTTDDRIAIGGRGAPYRLGSPIDEGHERKTDGGHRPVSPPPPPLSADPPPPPLPGAPPRRHHAPLGRAAGRAPGLVHERDLRHPQRDGLGGGLCRA